MKKIIIVIAVLIVVVGAYFMIYKGSSGTPVFSPTATTDLTTNTPMPTIQSSTTPTASASNTPKATAAPSVTIAINNFAFSPATKNIKVGTKVTWTNNDSVSHTVTSDSGGLLNSPTLAPGQSFSFTFTNPGSFSYHCALHPSMKGSIIVSN